MKRYVIAVLAVSGLSLGLRAEELEMTRETLARWVETRRLISAEKQKWELEREILSDRLDLVRTETGSLTEKINETHAQITDADQKRADLVKDNDELKSASATLVNRIFAIERSVLALLPTLPGPVQERIKPLSQRIPAGEKTDLSLSERYQNVVGIINELNKNANELAVVSESKELPDGSRAEVQTLYIGFARAYYCTLKGDIAGIGYPAENGWKWDADNTIAREVADAIAVLKNEKVATYIPLPVTVK